MEKAETKSEAVGREEQKAWTNALLECNMKKGADTVDDFLVVVEISKRLEI